MVYAADVFSVQFSSEPHDGVEFRLLLPTALPLAHLVHPSALRQLDLVGGLLLAERSAGG